MLMRRQPLNPFGIAASRSDVAEPASSSADAVPASEQPYVPIERADVDEPPFDEVIELGREGGMDVDVVEVKPCVATGQGANVMDSEALPFIEVDGDATVRVDQLRWFVSEQVGAAAVDGERLIREGCRRSLRASAHIGQRESDPENARGGHSQSGTRVEPPSSSGPEEAYSCVRRGKPVVETVSTSVAFDLGESEGAVDSGDQAMFELERALNLAYRDEMRDGDRELLQVIGQLGGCKHRYLRERRRAIKHIVSEIYSPPRVTAAAKLLPELRCVPGFALDLTVQNEQGLPWDFDLLENRQRARERWWRKRNRCCLSALRCARPSVPGSTSTSIDETQP